MKARLHRVALMTLVFASIAAAQGPAPVKVDYTINPEKVLNRIDEKVYGHFFEHIYHSANGGLWGEMVWNRSFEEYSGGRWFVKDDLLVQSGMGDNIRFDFGDPKWTDYEMTLEARKTGGSEGFLILFRVAGPEDYYWYNAGGWANVRSQLEKASKGAGRGSVGTSVDGKIDTDKWYSIRLRCEGNHYQVWIDGKQMLDYIDTQSPHLSGRVGVGTWVTTAQYRKIKVTTLDGKTTLFEGLPQVGPAIHVARHWSFYGQGECAVSDHRREQRHTASPVRFIASSSSAEAGIQQAGFCINKGETYIGSVWLRGSEPVPDSVTVRLVSGGKSIAEQRIDIPTHGWTRFQIRVPSPSIRCQRHTPDRRSR